MSERTEKARAVLLAHRDASASTAVLPHSPRDVLSPKSKTMREHTTSPSSSPGSKDKKKEKDDKKKQRKEKIAVDQEQMLPHPEHRPQCDAGPGCTSTDPKHWIQFQHTPRSPLCSTASQELSLRSAESRDGKSPRKTPSRPRAKSREKLQQSDEVHTVGGGYESSGSNSDGSGVLGTVIVHGNGHGSGADDDDSDSGEDTGTMVIRDALTLERLHSSDYEAVDTDVASSRSETATNSPRPWLNKYRSPETWERNIIALEKGEFTEDMNEEAFGKYVRNKPRPSAQQLFVQLSSCSLLATTTTTTTTTSTTTSASSSASSSPASSPRDDKKAKKQSKKKSALSASASAPPTPH